LIDAGRIHNSISLTSKIENSFDALGKKPGLGGGVKAPFMGTSTYMPRVLVEMGFISNYTEGNY
jgi:N-acetylmuramoyl-L-alanine amidase